ncbi:MAG: class II aldolase/adducin family protein [Chloroflexi bacterium]|nr:class II aldolase/adducin family protein [Chloroflexota bacterium]
MIEQLIEAGRRIVAAGMVKGWAGNLSGRYQSKIVITRSGADLGDLTQADFVFINPRALHLEQRLPRPSSELAMHLGAYEARPQIQVVIHAHPPQAIGVGLLGKSLPALTPDFYRHLGASAPLLPYIAPTTENLKTAVSLSLQSTSAVLLQNHGVVVVGRSVSQTLLRLNLLEEQAKIYLAALAAGKPRILSEADMWQLDELAGGAYRRET